MRSFKTILLSVAAALLVSCGTTKTVPITGRQQSLMVSDGDVSGVYENSQAIHQCR